MSRVPYIIRDEKLRAQVAGLISSLSLERPWSIVIEPYRKKRTLNQNALYWKWVGIVADETGNANDDVHAAFKAKFITPRTITIGESEVSISSTTKYTTLEMKDFMDKVYAFVTSELGILLPLPEELGRE